jgi:hypothetical protein
MRKYYFTSLRVEKPNQPDVGSGNSAKRVHICIRVVQPRALGIEENVGDVSDDQLPNVGVRLGLKPR